jgi:hypothetical protein
MSLTVNDQNLGHATAYGYAKSQGYTGTEEEFAELMASYATVAQSAAASADAAEADALKAEGYAVGKQDGSDVGSGSPYYQANAKYYKDQAESKATTATQKATSASNSADSALTNARKAEGFAVGKQNGSDVGSTSPYYHANAKYYKDQAADSATTATQKASAADGSAVSAALDALKAEGFAVGKQDGEAVASDSPYYHNNAEYFKDQAASDAAHCDEVAESIPEDYSELSQTVEGMVTALAAMGLVVYNGQFYINPDGNTLPE